MWGGGGGGGAGAARFGAAPATFFIFDSFLNSLEASVPYKPLSTSFYRGKTSMFPFF